MRHHFTRIGPLRNPWAHIIAFLNFALLPLFSFSSIYTPLVDFVVTSGDNPEDISWVLEDIDGNVVISGGAPFFQTLELPIGTYYLTMNDAVGDGWNGANYHIIMNQSQAPYEQGTLSDPTSPWDPEPPVGPQSNTIQIIFLDIPFDQSCVDGMEAYLGEFDVNLDSYAYQATTTLYVVFESHCCGEWSAECQAFYENLDDNFFFGALVPGSIPEIIPAVAFNDSRLFVNLDDGENEDTLGCAVADIGQKYLWFKFTAGHTNSLVSARREGAGNFNGVIEVYDGLGGTEIVCQDAYTSANEVAVFPTEIGETYYIKVYHNGASALTSGNISVGVAYVPQTELRSIDCGTMNLTDASIIRSNWPANTFLLENWMFRFEELEPPYNVYEVLSPNGSNPQFRWFWFPQREPGRTYEVRTKPRMYQGPTWADYGDACIIGTAEGVSTPPSGLTTYQGGLSTAPGELSMQLWPNPTQDEVNIAFAPSSDDSRADITVFDVSGKEIDRIQHNFDRGASQVVTYTNERLEPGIYLFHIRTENATSVARLVVTQQ